MSRVKNKLEVIYFIKDMSTQPLFKVGDLVRQSKDLYGLTESMITQVDRKYKAVDENGNFDPDGLVSMENDMGSCCLPWSFDGKVLRVEFPRTDYGGWIQKAYVLESRFAGYIYVTKNSEMNSIWPETSLKLLRE